MSNEKFTPGQLLRSVTTDTVFEIKLATDKAIAVEYDNSGRWNRGKAKLLWIPINILEYIGFNDNKDNSQNGIHVVRVAEWFINKNRNIGW